MYWYKQKTPKYMYIDVVHALVINPRAYGGGGGGGVDATPHKVFLDF